MKSIPMILAAAALTLSACATPFRASADLASVSLEREDSPSVLVDKLWLEREGGGWRVRGSVLKRLGAPDTPGTHLDVILYDRDGTVLRSTCEDFSPARLARRGKFPAFGRYDVRLDALPAPVARITVRAHDGAHS